MKPIQILQDIQLLRKISSLLSPVFIDYLESYYDQLRGELERQDGENFELEQSYSLVLLEPDDDLFNVAAGIRLSGNADQQELCPEYVELIPLGYGIAMYKIVFMPDNECMVTLFAQAETLEEETEKWLHFHCPLPVNELILKKLQSTFDKGTELTSPADKSDVYRKVKVPRKIVVPYPKKSCKITHHDRPR